MGVIIYFHLTEVLSLIFPRDSLVYYEGRAGVFIITDKAKPGREEVKGVVVYYNGESERYREEMRWCRWYEGQRTEV